MQKKGRRKKKKTCNPMENLALKRSSQRYSGMELRISRQGRRPYVLFQLGPLSICSFLVRVAAHMFFFWLGVVLFNLCKQTTQLWFNLLPYCLLQGGCQFRDLRYGDRDRRNSVANIIGTKHKSMEGTNQSSEFEFELKFECSFSFFRCFVVSINSYGRSLEL